MAKTNGEIKGETNMSSAIGRKRERYIEAMQLLLKKNVIRYVGNDKHIKIIFSKSGIDHVAEDIVKKKLKISTKEASGLDHLLREATYMRSCRPYKDRNDHIKHFYYFNDKNKDLRYVIAEEVFKGHHRIFLYSLQKG